MMRTALLLAAACVACSAFASPLARNVILFIGDAAGISTLHAASLHGHRQPQGLFIQQMPHVALMDTSAADRWVTDSAAAMSAIVTGQKTKNGVISQSADAVPQKSDGAVLKTILEHAEERGLSTGVITNTSIADATPAACYAHSNSRRNTGEIFAQLANPRAGDGADVVVGRGRSTVFKATKELDIDIEGALRAKGYAVLDEPSKITAEQGRVVAVTDSTFQAGPVVERAIEILSRNPKGYFLMVEWDMHANNLRRGLDHVLELDAVIRKVAEQVGDDTLIIFAADHSYDLRVRGGKPGEPLLAPEPPADAPGAGASASEPKSGVAASVSEPKKSPSVRVDDSHTGEQVLVAAKGPGADRVHGFIANTDLFRIMMTAFGWE